MAELTGLRTHLDLGGDARGRTRYFGVLIFILVVLAALIPGAAIRLGLANNIPGAPGVWLATFGAELQKIDFGHGLRFWLGVTGAAMMALLLLYPLRKMMGLSRLISITAWFHLHVILGLVGPALVVYHSNFGLGSRPANVALFTTLLVAVSGVIGYFLYTRYSAIFYAIKGRARVSLESALASLRTIEPSPTRNGLIERLQQFDRMMLEERRGLIASSRSSRAIRTFRGAWLRDAAGSGLPVGRNHPLRRQIDVYFAQVRRSERWSIYERLWAKWRLMHLPVFAITVIAATIHVVRVWDMDGPAAALTGAQQEVAELASRESASDLASGSSSAPAAQPSPAQQVSPLAVRSIHTLAVKSTPASASTPAPVLVAAPRLAVRPGRTATPREVAASIVGPSIIPVADAAVAARAAEAKPIVALAEATQALASPEPIDVATAQAASPPPAAGSARVRPMPVASERAPDARPAESVPERKRPTVTAQLAPPPVTKARPKANADGADAAIAELARRNAQDNRGRFDPATLAARLAQLKQEKFDHSKTDFKLTGKHAKAKCESCHKATLKDTKKECIACHKRDDVHKGRKPDCAACHVTTDWSRIVKRR